MMANPKVSPDKNEYSTICFSVRCFFIGSIATNGSKTISKIKYPNLAKILLYENELIKKAAGSSCNFCNSLISSNPDIASEITNPKRKSFKDFK